MEQTLTVIRNTILPLINTVILVAIFIYQRNRNKLLSERILEQGALLKETNELVAKQATAITSHGTIVDSAIKYSQGFDISKIEAIVRREVSLEKEEEIRKIKDEYEKQASNIQDNKSVSTEVVIEKLAQSSANVAGELFKDIIIQYAVLLVKLPKSKREESVAAIENESARSIIKSVLERVYAIIGAEQLDMIAKQ